MSQEYAKTKEYQDFIGIYDNYFHPSFFNEIIDYYKTCEDQGLLHGSYGPKHERDDECIYMVNPDVIKTVPPNFSQYFYDVLKNHILPDYIYKFSILQKINFDCDSLKLKCISPGGGFHNWHYESRGHDIDRKLVLQLYLNTIDDGGETEFLYQRKRFKATENRMLVWPADFTYTHRGNPPLSEHKYILTTWLNEVKENVLSSNG